MVWTLWVQVNLLPCLHYPSLDKTIRTNLIRFGPLNGLVSKSAKFSSVFTYCFFPFISRYTFSNKVVRKDILLLLQCRFNRRFTEPKIIDHANILDQLLLHIGTQSKGSAARTNRSHTHTHTHTHTHPRAVLWLTFTSRDHNARSHS